VWYCLSAGVSCATIRNADGAAMAAAKDFGMTDHRIWSKLRANQLNTRIKLKKADKEVCSQYSEN